MLKIKRAYTSDQTQLKHSLKKMDTRLMRVGTIVVALTVCAKQRKSLLEISEPLNICVNTPRSRLRNGRKECVKNERFRSRSLVE